MDRVTDTASVNGIAMKPALKQLNRMRADGSLSCADLDRLLSGEALRQLEAGVVGGKWYPVSIQNEFLDLIRKREGKGRDEYLIGFGRQTASEVMSTPGLRMLINGAKAVNIQVGKMLVRMAAIGFNFGSWEFDGEDLQVFSVIATEANALPDTICLNICGFIEHVASTWEEKEIACKYQRSSSGRLLFEARPTEARPIA